MWFDHYISIGQYTAAQRIAEADTVPAHAPPALRGGGGAAHESVRVAGLHLPNYDPRDAATIIQKAVRGEQARAAALWLREEQKHRAWLQYCVATGQIEQAAGLGLYHELAAEKIQRAFRRSLVSSNGYELSCPKCQTQFVLTRVPEGRVSHKCPACKTHFMVEVAEQAWWKSPVLIKREDDAAFAAREAADADAARPFSRAQIDELELARKEWIRYYLALGDVDAARRLGFDYELRALRIQRAWKRYRHGVWAVYEAEKAERALLQAAEHARKAAAVAQRHAALVLQRAARRKRRHMQYKRARLAELAARAFQRKTDAIGGRFVRALIERGFERAKRQHEAARVISRTYRRMAAARAHTQRRAVTAMRTARAARVIQRLYVRHKLADLERFAQGYLSKRSHKGKWQLRYFYIHRQHLCYLPAGGLAPQPNPSVATRKAIVKWDQLGVQPGKAVRMADIQSLVGDPQSRELELTLANGEKHQYKAVSEHELLLWKRTFEKYTRYRGVTGVRL